MIAPHSFHVELAVYCGLIASLSPCHLRALLAAEGAPVEESRLGFVSHWAGDRFHHTTILTLVERNLLRLDGRYPGRKAILTSDGGEAIRHWRITREAAA